MTTISEPTNLRPIDSTRIDQKPIDSDPIDLESIDLESIEDTFKKNLTKLNETNSEGVHFDVNNDSFIHEKGFLGAIKLFFAFVCTVGIVPLVAWYKSNQHARRIENILKNVDAKLLDIAYAIKTGNSTEKKLTDDANYPVVFSDKGIVIKDLIAGKEHVIVSTENFFKFVQITRGYKTARTANEEGFDLEILDKMLHDKYSPLAIFLDPDVYKLTTDDIKKTIVSLGFNDESAINKVAEYFFGQIQQVSNANNLMQNSLDSVSFQVGVLKLASCIDETKLSLQVTSETNGDSLLTVKLDDTTIRTLQFEGDLKLNDRLFDLDADSKTYSLKPLADPEVEDIRKLYMYAVDINAHWVAHRKDSTIFEEANRPIKDKDLEVGRRDLNRIVGFLPLQKDVLPLHNGAIKVATKEWFTHIVQTHFKPDIKQNTAEFNALYHSYSELSFNEKSALSLACNKETKEQDPLWTEKLEPLKAQFNQLNENEQKKMGCCFDFFLTNKYVGEQSDFMSAFDQLPLEEKWLFFLVMNQELKTPFALIDALGPLIFDPNGGPARGRTKETYFYKLVKKFEETRTAEIDIELHADFDPISNRNLNRNKRDKDSKEELLPSVLHKVATAKSTVTFPKQRKVSETADSENGIGYKLHEDTLKFSAVVLNADGSTPVNCKRVPMIEFNSMHMMNDGVPYQRVQGS